MQLTVARRGCPKELAPEARNEFDPNSAPGKKVISWGDL